jgi:hypothetical protein
MHGDRLQVLDRQIRALEMLCSGLREENERARSGTPL